MYRCGIRITEKDIYKTGFATVGKEFNYQLDQLRYYKEGENYFVLDNIYNCYRICYKRRDGTIF